MAKRFSIILVLGIVVFVLWSFGKSLSLTKSRQNSVLPVQNNEIASEKEFTYGIAVIDSLEVVVLESFPVQIRAIVIGHLPDGCTSIDEVKAGRKGSHFDIEVVTKRPTNDFCTQTLVPFKEPVSLDVSGIEKGVYEVQAGEIKKEFELTQDNILKSDG